jgi:Asp-tRNA(Asn)/Glu-tRNA(Gln) amidotransferase A subunit family amidase
LLAQSGTALEEADKLDAHFKDTGTFIGPLHGIPVIVKDQAETKGIATTYGSIIAKNHVPLEDSTVVKKLKDAGAIILAKSTMPGKGLPHY